MSRSTIGVPIELRDRFNSVAHRECPTSPVKTAATLEGLLNALEDPAVALLIRVHIRLAEDRRYEDFCASRSAGGDARAAARPIRT